ncbi:hypothetical protein SAMN04487910_0121 [Aquimarina amphilecti]|uniref:Uncharacterized protein n=1 Tax=Aquimarina amphilecti TaxID=1038014 RepID=A0A1H7FKU9_AQUAM|nr:hypothetical protein [Aquimarina amphilecti]SEK26716.1 hypothetical protein SAMN04487910_0121 [Aquimarina amphilecti]
MRKKIEVKKIQLRKITISKLNSLHLINGGNYYHDDSYGLELCNDHNPDGNNNNNNDASNNCQSVTIPHTKHCNSDDYNVG